MPRPRTGGGRPLGGRAGYTALHGARLSSVPSGDQSANPASVPGRSGLQRALLSVSSVYAPNFPGSTTWLCEPVLARLFPCHSCAFHTLSIAVHSTHRDLQVWRRGHLVHHSVYDAARNPGGERPRLRM